jgi:hypothetical protein
MDLKAKPEILRCIEVDADMWFEDFLIFRVTSKHDLCQVISDALELAVQPPAFKICHLLLHNWSYYLDQGALDRAFKLTSSQVIRRQILCCASKKTIQRSEFF